MAPKIDLDGMDVEYGIANDLRIGTIVLIHDRSPCKVLELHRAKTGKHGSAKIAVVAMHIFTKKKMEEIFQSTAQVCLPKLDKVDYELLDLLEDDYISLVLPSGVTRQDVRLEGKEKNR
eukprot:TRINITY_DN1133_c0_g1_i4.p1 TRINITY_DN1133_c0_g1~~TRINITY_DN1133_c0_g1_i4.p1  ORF type:complete len:119 (-),score=36.57 TRINITY_DN1133_c0_g1_i4:348-704(-)